ncbi:MAG: hypothetical protein [Wendovervirus sonii]|uniref:Uncharacterized protein n=1 Tax=phage Lak_Megaphage_Sonny TaxID=3109229 RepID=A0ABZ0Z3F6_9CAUD|nr:MAG: hypothetical protein [phage Lak_Megaphage_Sonny]
MVKIKDDEQIVYFFINDWQLKEDFKRLFYCYLNGYISVMLKRHVDFPEGIVCKSIEDEYKWAIDNKICINIDIYDMATLFWITAPKEWVEKNFPEILPFVKQYPEDRIFKNDRKYYLKYIPENFGYHYATSMDDDTVEYLAAGRYAFPELFNI